MVDSLNTVLELSREVVADPLFSLDPQRVARARRQAGDYLGEVAAFCRRLEALADDCFPSAAADIRRRFASLRSTNAAFRLVWELRNDSEHGRDPLDATVRSTDASGVTWRYDLPRLFSLRSGKDWQLLSALLAGVDVVGVADVYWAAFNAVERHYHEWIVAQEASIEAAADLVTCLFAAAQPNDGDAVALIQSEWATPSPVVPLRAEQVDMMAVGYAIGTLEGAREALV